MAKYKKYNYSQMVMISVSLENQLMPGQRRRKGKGSANSYQIQRRSTIMGLLDMKNVREKIYPEKKGDNYKKIKSKTKIF